MTRGPIVHIIFCFVVAHADMPPGLHREGEGAVPSAADDIWLLQQSLDVRYQEVGDRHNEGGLTDTRGHQAETDQESHYHSNQPVRTLFVAVKVYNEYDLLEAWRQTYGSPVVQENGEVELRFFTYNPEFANHSEDMVYMPEATSIDSDYPGPGEDQFSIPTFWKDLRVGMYRWALQHINFRYWLEVEIDSVPCFKSVLSALTVAPPIEFTLGYNYDNQPPVCSFVGGAPYNDNMLIATRGYLRGVAENWHTYRERLMAEPDSYTMWDPLRHQTMFPCGHKEDMGPSVTQLAKWLNEDAAIAGNVTALRANPQGCDPYVLVEELDAIKRKKPQCWYPILHCSPADVCGNAWSKPNGSWSSLSASGQCDVCSERLHIHPEKNPQTVRNAWDISQHAKEGDAHSCVRSTAEWATWWKMTLADPIHLD